jgi:hypothetical protein
MARQLKAAKTVNGVNRIVCWLKLGLELYCVGV